MLRLKSDLLLEIADSPVPGLVPDVQPAHSERVTEFYPCLPMQSLPEAQRHVLVQDGVSRPYAQREIHRYSTVVYYVTILEWEYQDSHLHSYPS